MVTGKKFFIVSTALFMLEEELRKNPSLLLNGKCIAGRIAAGLCQSGREVKKVYGIEVAILIGKEENYGGICNIVDLYYLFR